MHGGWIDRRKNQLGRPAAACMNMISGTVTPVRRYQFWSLQSTTCRLMEQNIRCYFSIWILQINIFFEESGTFSLHYDIRRFPQYRSEIFSSDRAYTRTAPDLALDPRHSQLAMANFDIIAQSSIMLHQKMNQLWRGWGETARPATRPCRQHESDLDTWIEPP